jgi:hypothetical protein
MNMFLAPPGTIGVSEARVQSFLVMDYKTSWPMLMHMAVSDCVVTEAAGGGLQDDLSSLLRRHMLEMVYYAAAPDGTGIAPYYHIYRPDADGRKYGGVEAVEYWFNCMVHMLKANAEDKAAKAAAALSHFCADLSNPVHTVSDDSVHTPYENWLKDLFVRRDSDPQSYGRLYTELKQQTHQRVTVNRHLLMDVKTAVIQELIKDAHDAWPALRDLWRARNPSDPASADVDADLVALTSDRFAAGANFTADLWYSAFDRSSGTLPAPDQRLGDGCPDFDTCISRLDARVQELVMLTHYS